MRPEREIRAEAVGLDLGAVAAVLEGRHGDPFAVLGTFRDRRPGSASDIPARSARRGSHRAG
jgi:hypothetical protein